MKVDYQKVLERLKEERERLGLTQDELCRKIYMSQGHYCKAETGKNRFTYSELKYLVKAGIDLHYIYTGERISHPEYYIFFTECGRRERQCLAEMALPMIAYYAQESVPGKEGDIQHRIKYVKCVLTRDRQEDSYYYQLRRYKAYSQKYMAGLLGVDVKKYCSLESSKSFGDSEIVLQVYNCFQVSPLILLNDENGLARELCALLEKLEDKAGQKVFEYIKRGYDVLMVV